jgi:hypothetical protein
MVTISQAKEAYKKLDFEKSYRALFELLWYSQMPCYDVRDVTSNKKNEFGEFNQDQGHKVNHLTSKTRVKHSNKKKIEKI